MWTLRDLDWPGSHLFGPAHGCCAKTLISKCARAQYLNISLPLSLIFYYILYIIYIYIYIQTHTERIHVLDERWQYSCPYHGFCLCPETWVKNMGPKMDAYSTLVTWFHMIPPMSLLDPEEVAQLLHIDCRFPNGSSTSENSNIIEIQIPLDCYEGVGETMKFSKVEQGWVVIYSGFKTGCWMQGSWLAVWKPVISLLTRCRRCVYRGSRRSGISNGSWPRYLIMLEQGRARWPVDPVWGAPDFMGMILIHHSDIVT